ncbi:MAG TPA: hypothetical protein VGG30_08885, partial [Pirellulales bacterium]
MRTHLTANNRFFAAAAFRCACALWAASSALALAATAAAEPQGRSALLASGKTFVGELVAADAEGRLTFRATGQRGATTETVPAAQLVRWGQFVESSHGAQLLLADGGLLIAELTAIDREKLTVKSELFGDVTLPAPAVLAVLLHPPADPHRRDQLVGQMSGAAGGQNPADAGAESSRADASAAGTDRAGIDRGGVQRASGDRVFLDNGDELRGTVAAWHNDSLSVDTDAGRVDLAAAQITAIQFHRPVVENSAPPRRLLVVGWRDGSRLTAVSLVAD